VTVAEISETSELGGPTIVGFKVLDVGETTIVVERGGSVVLLAKKLSCGPAVKTETGMIVLGGSLMLIELKISSTESELAPPSTGTVS
jgi:hypothetical protein